MARVIMHIDMNSYFATVEQQANPLLRGKPVAVSGRPHINSVVAAASIEAKKFGVKSGMGTWEARRICPNLIFIPGDPTKYVSLSGRLIKIFKNYVPMVEVFSIDEAFLDLTDVKDVKDIKDSVGIALEIKDRIKREIGSRVTCSIGIASNKFLAKLASEKKKPDGLTVVTVENLDNILLSSALSDFCGIGRHILKRLNDMGIYTVARLREIPRDCLVATFGTKGEQIHDMSLGVDSSAVIPDFKSPEAKSFSHSLTLEKEISDRKYLEAVLLYLCEKVARRMRSENFLGRVICCNGVQRSLPYYTDDGQKIFEIGKKLFGQLPTRAIYIGVENLQKGGLTSQSLLPEIQKQEMIVSSLDIINSRFGENSVFRAAVLPVFSRDKNVAGIRTRFRFQ